MNTADCSIPLACTSWWWETQWISMFTLQFRTEMPWKWFWSTSKMRGWTEWANKNMLSSWFAPKVEVHQSQSGQTMSTFLSNPLQSKYSTAWRLNMNLLLCRWVVEEGLIIASYQAIDFDPLPEWRDYVHSWSSSWASSMLLTLIHTAPFTNETWGEVRALFMIISMNT